MNETDLESRIYEAAFSADLWPELLEDMSGIAESPGGALMILESARSSAGQWTASPVTKEMMKRFLSERWAANNSRLAVAFNNGTAFEPRFISEDDIFENESYRDEPMYRDFLYPGGLGRSLGTVFTHVHGDILILTFERPASLGPYSPDIKSRLDALRPHLARSAMVASRLAFERMRTAVQTLETLGLAAAALASDGRVVVANTLFENDPSMAVGARNILLLPDRKAGEQLTESLQAIETQEGLRSLPLRDENGSVRQVLHLLPVRRTAHDLFTGAAAIVVLSTSSADTNRSANLIRSLFDLTPAEAGIAARIGHGETIAAIALADAKSVHTVRGQLKSVFAKTGCARQSDLVRLITDLVPVTNQSAS